MKLAVGIRWGKAIGEEGKRLIATALRRKHVCLFPPRINGGFTVAMFEEFFKGGIHRTAAFTRLVFENRSAKLIQIDTVETLLERVPDRYFGDARCKKCPINSEVESLIIGHRKAPVLACCSRDGRFVFDEVIKKVRVEFDEVDLVNPVFSASPQRRQKWSQVIIIVKKLKYLRGRSQSSRGPESAGGCFSHIGPQLVMALGGCYREPRSPLVNRLCCYHQEGAVEVPRRYDLCVKLTSVLPLVPGKFSAGTFVHIAISERYVARKGDEAIDEAHGVP
jgi:hypothetical protein